MKIAVKYDTTLAKYGILTLINNYLKHFDDWSKHQNEDYDIVFCIYTDANDVKAKSKVLLCAAQTIDNYFFVEGNDKFKQNADSFTDVVLLRYVEDIYKTICKDYSNCNVFCTNFNLFTFDNEYYDCNRKDIILHLGRLCNFKHSLDIITTKKYVSNYEIHCYGNGLLDNNVLTSKGQKYSKYINNNKNIKLLSSYKQDELYNIAKNYKYCICTYCKDFSDNIEYAMLEMINAGCIIILNEDYVKNFNKSSKLGKITSDMYISKTDDMSIDECINKSNKFLLKDYKDKWTKLYDNNKIINSIIKKLRR